MRKTASIVVLTSALALAACAASPKAKLSLVERPEDLSGQEVDTYAFPRTLVEITAGQGTAVAVTTRNQSFDGFRIALRRADTPGTRTNLNLTKVANSDMLDEAGVQLFDDRVKMIGELGKVATSLIGLGVVPFSGTLSLPASLDTQPLLARLQPGASTEDVGKPETWQKAGEIAYWVGPVQPDARPVTTANIAGLSSGIAYAACREMRLQFEVDVTTTAGDTPTTETRTIAQTVQVSDPRYFRFVAFPRKGKIKLHPQCGSSVTSEKDEGIASDPAVLNALLAQVNDIKKKIDEAEASSGAKP